MKSGLALSLLVAAFLGAACSNNPNYRGSRAQGADPSGHRLVKCERYAATGSRLKRAVRCDDGSRKHGFEVRTWRDIERDRAK